MSEFEIEKREFDNNKKQLKEFAEKHEQDLYLQEFKSSEGPFDLFNHKVTGDEMNNFIEVLQTYLFEFSESDKRIIKEFQHVYDTFDALDKEYINGIVGNIKTLKETSDDNRKKHEQIAELISFLKNGIKENESKLEEHSSQITEHDRLLREGQEKDKEHDEKLSSQIKKDEEHDRLLRESKEKDNEQDRLLNQQIEKDEEHDRLLQEIRDDNKELEITVAKLGEKVSYLEKIYDEQKNTGVNAGLVYAAIGMSLCGLIIGICQLVM